MAHRIFLGRVDFAEGLAVADRLEHRRLLIEEFLEHHRQTGARIGDEIGEVEEVLIDASGEPPTMSPAETVTLCGWPPRKVFAAVAR